MSKQAMKMALDALEKTHPFRGGYITQESFTAQCAKHDKAITALRAALDAPEREPLTNEQITKIWNSPSIKGTAFGYTPFARAIEQEVRWK